MARKSAIQVPVIDVATQCRGLLTAFLEGDVARRATLEPLRNFVALHCPPLEQREQRANWVQQYLAQQIAENYSQKAGKGIVVSVKSVAGIPWPKFEWADGSASTNGDMRHLAHNALSSIISRGKIGNRDSEIDWVSRIVKSAKEHCTASDVEKIIVMLQALLTQKKADELKAATTPKITPTPTATATAPAPDINAMMAQMQAMMAQMMSMKK